MSIVARHAPTTSTLAIVLPGIAALAAFLAGWTGALMLVLPLRFFVFEYFHGNPAPLRTVVRFVSAL